MNQIAPIENRNVLDTLSSKYGMKPAEFQAGQFSQHVLPRARMRSALPSLNSTCS